MSRDRFKYDLTILSNHGLPIYGCFPSLIEWKVNSSPAALLSDRNCHFIKFIISESKVENLKAALFNFFKDGSVQLEYSGEMGLSEILKKPNGSKEL